MTVEGALVSYSLTENNNFNSTFFSASGIKFCRRWVLAHGSFVSPLKNALKILKSKQKLNSTRDVNEKYYRALPTVYVSHEVGGGSSLDNSLEKKSIDITTNEYSSKNILISRGKIKYLWTCDLLNDAVDKMMSSWTIGHKQGNIDTQNDQTGKTFLPVFVLIDFGGENHNNESLVKVLQQLFQVLSKQVPLRGEEITLKGTPFGNEVFLNSVTSGVICNTVGRNDSLILCDASSSLCCEGGPAFIKRNGKLFGMTISSLSWWRGEWVGITLTAFLTPVIHSVLFSSEKYDITHGFLAPKDLPIFPILDEIDQSVVLVRCGESWGSAVTVGQGYFITCSHVVKNHNEHGLIINSMEKTGRASVIFRSNDNMTYDLALLFSNDFQSLKNVEFAQTPAFKGETVVAAGFPFFSDKNISNIKPTIMKGYISNVYKHMIQTSCCIQSGCSGGAIFRIHQSNKNKLSCELLGIIVCNVKCDQNHSSYPNVNMAVPVSVFRNTLEDYIKNPCVSLLHKFENMEPIVQSTWNLRTISSKL